MLTEEQMIAGATFYRVMEGYPDNAPGLCKLTIYSVGKYYVTVTGARLTRSRESIFRFRRYYWPTAREAWEAYIEAKRQAIVGFHEEISKAADNLGVAQRALAKITEVAS